MNSTSQPLERRWSILLAGALIALSALLVYRNSFAGAFVFDDHPSILGNPTIQHLGSALQPPSGALTVSGRPLLNLSFAVNYVLGGVAPWGYHAMNLLIHILAALTLFGLLRRTLKRWSALPPTRWPTDGAAQRVGDNALHPVLFAFIAALLWTVHPLQTESVTYVAQRAESLMGLFYLLTLYGFVRWTEGAKGIWAGLAVLACLLGMLTKEVMATAPLIVFLYDRTFVSGTFQAAWRRHARLYLALAATWIPLAWAVWANGGNRGGSVGPGADIAAGSYLLTQFPALVHYLKLSVWPDPLVFDYGLRWLGQGGAIALAALLLLPALALTAVALRRWPALGFLGAWFFVILAPSSLPGIRQSLAEHRMYLPLAGVIVLGLLLLRSAWGRLFPRADARGYLAVGLALAAAFGALTIRRNGIYRSESALAGDTVVKAPGNGYARAAWAALLEDQGQNAAAVDQYAAAARLLPAKADFHYDLANALVQAGRPEEAVPEFQEAIRLRPDFAEAECNLGIVLTLMNRPADALPHYQAALRLKPDYPEGHYNLGNALVALNRPSEAMEQYLQALRFRPDYAAAHCNLGNALLQFGQVDSAVKHFEEALRLQPDYAEAHYDLANTLGRQGKLPEAIAHYQAAARLEPDFAPVRSNLGVALARVGRGREARDEFAAAVRLNPDSAGYRVNLGNVCYLLGDFPAAIREFETALQLQPGYPGVSGRLARARQALRAQSTHP